MKQMKGYEYFRKALYLKFVQNVSCYIPTCFENFSWISSDLELVQNV